MNVSDAVRALCLSLPETEEVESHSMANFRVRGKTFATYALNHHGDGRVALWLEAPSGSQSHHIQLDPLHYFKPPYVGPKGWLGVELNKKLPWTSVKERIREAYAKVAPSELTDNLDFNVKLAKSVRKLKPEEVNPFAASKVKKLLEKINKHCSSYPETIQATGFGNPQWKAGKKTYVCVHRYNNRLTLQVWVGLEQQSFLIADERFKIPAYVGHNGWIDLDIESDVNWNEVESLIEQSYRHFALKRMLKALDS